MLGILARLFRWATGKLYFQKYYEHLLRLSILGMNHYNLDFQKNGEKWVLLFLKQKIKITGDSKIFFDVGANVGQYTQLLSEIFDDQKSTIYSFEPSAITFSELTKRFIQNKNVRIYNFGFSDRPEELTFFSNDPATSSSLSSIYDRHLEHIGIAMQPSEKINVVTIDNFCKENKINKINFLKIDVEGHELKVLEGAANMLNEKRIYAIQFEFGACAIDSRIYFKDFYGMLSSNYNLFRIVKNGIYPIEKYQETLEIFCHTNFLALLKGP